MSQTKEKDRIKTRSHKDDSATDTAMTDFEPSEDISITLSKILSNQNALFTKIDRKCDSIMEEMTGMMHEKITSLKEELLNDIQCIKTDLESAQRAITDLSSRMDSIESEPENIRDIPQIDPVSDTSRTIIMKGVPSHIQDTSSFAQRVLQAIEVHDSVEITQTLRLNSRIPGRPGLVKVALRNVQDRIRVLKAKQKLQESEFAGIYIRGSKNHTERLIELNARTILNNIPDGNKNFRIASNGRIIPRTQPRTEESIA